MGHAGRTIIALISLEPFIRAIRRRLSGLVAIGFVLGISLEIGCRAQQPWPMWESYTHRMIDSQGRVIDHSAQDRTTSEGQSYAMFFALVDNDRPRFEKLLNWTEVNLAGGDLGQHLPAWSWGKKPDGSWKILDQNPAADADLWIAYSLVEAGRLWHEPHYDKLGTLMMARIAQQEVVYVPGLGTTLLSGPVGFHPNAETWLLNPSYFPPPVLARFAQAMPSGPWGAVLDSLQSILDQGSGAGFVMDWVSAGSVIQPSVAPSPLASAGQDVPIGSYDAIRVYLWLGIADPQTRGTRALFSKVPGMATYLKTHSMPPEKVDSTGRIISPNGPPGFSAAVYPYLQALGMNAQAKAQIDRLAATKDASTGLYGRDASYYDQNLALFATGWSEQRYRFDRDGRLRVGWK
jgi:endo-1,4-beta-D-glucanase Y